MVQKSRGDTADILQTVRLQRELFARPKLSRVSCAKSIVEWSDAFIQAYQARKAGNEDYLKLVEMSIGCYKETSQTATEKRALAEIIRNLKNPAELQRAHLNYLLALANAIGSK